MCVGSKLHLLHLWLPIKSGWSQYAWILLACGVLDKTLWIQNQREEFHIRAMPN